MIPSRRGFIAGLAAMTTGAFRPGGDRLPAGQRPDQRYNPPGAQVAAGGRSAILRAREVIIVGSSGLLLAYSPTAAAGNLVESIATGSGADTYGNAYLPGIVAYFNTGVNFTAVQQNQGEIAFWTAPAAGGPWASVASVQGNATNGVVVQPYLTLVEEASAPATPLAAGTLYVNGTGHLVYLGPSGTSTVLANP